MTDEQRRLEELRLWAEEQVPTTVPWVRDRVRLLLALVDDLQRVVADLCEESDAAREAMRYRRALEEVISHGCIATATTGGVDYTYRADLIAREALEGKS